MTISATIKNDAEKHQVVVTTAGNNKTLAIPGKSVGRGSAINGGELLFAALATCFCNDIYREAGKRECAVQSVEVTVTGEFGKEGEPGSNIRYTAQVEAPALSKEQIDELITYVDTVAEVHNTLRKGVEISLKKT